MFTDGDNGDDIPRPTRDEVDTLFANALAAWDAKQLQVGDIVPTKWFYDQLGVTYPELANSFEQAQAYQKQFLTLFYGDNGFRTYLLKQRKRFIKSNHARGYEVLAPAQQTDFAQRQRRRDINKALHDESTLLEHVDLNQLSAKQRQENADAIAHNVALARILHRRRPGFRSR